MLYRVKIGWVEREEKLCVVCIQVTVYPYEWLPISCRSGAGCRPGKVRRSETDVLPLSYTTNKTWSVQLDSKEWVMHTGKSDLRWGRWWCTSDGDEWWRTISARRLNRDRVMEICSPFHSSRRPLNNNNNNNNSGHFRPHNPWGRLLAAPAFLLLLALLLTLGIFTTEGKNNNNNNNNAGTIFMMLSSGVIVTARVHPVHLANVGQRQAATDPRIRPTDLGYNVNYTLCYQRIFVWWLVGLLLTVIVVVK